MVSLFSWGRRQCAADERLAAAGSEIARLEARCRDYAQQLEARAEEIRALTDGALLAAGGRAIFNPALNRRAPGDGVAWRPARRFQAWRQEQELSSARDYAAALRAGPKPAAADQL